jgi:four helix bundle protein
MCWCVCSVGLVRVWVVRVAALDIVSPGVHVEFSGMRPEDMRVYQVARELAKEVDKIIGKLPPRLKRIADHLERSMESAGLNLAEGLAAYRPGIKANAFEVARKETGEARKAIERAYDKDGITKAEIERAMSLANSYVGMLTVMIKQQEKRKIEEG